MAESEEKSSPAGCETQDSLKSGKLPYDDLPREELVKLAKKHLALLQKVKYKCDALNKECSQYKVELKIAKEAANREKEMESKVNELYRKYFPPDSTEDVPAVNLLNVLDKEFLEMKEKESQISRLEKELNKVKKEREIISLSFREAEEQVHCMTMKLETLTMTCQCLQEDLAKSQKLNKELSDEVNVLTAARDTALQSISSIKAKVSENNSLEMEHLKSKLEKVVAREDNLKTELTDYHDIVSNLQQELNMLVKSKAELESENLNLVKKCKVLTEEKESWKLQLEEYENEKVKFKTCSEKLCMTKQENEAYKTQNSELEKHIEELEEEKLKLSTQLCNEKSLLNEFNCQIEVLISSVKQGVKQKNASSKCKAENEPMQNISVLRVLYEEMSSQLQNHVMRTNFLETEVKSLVQQKKKIEEEMVQFMDLKQFLEDEVKGLSEENGQLKSILNHSGTHSDSEAAAVISRLERELQESLQREQELLNELNNYTPYSQDDVCPLEEQEINRISPSNIPETIMEETNEEDNMISGLVGNNQNEVKMDPTSSSSGSNYSSENCSDRSIQTIVFVSDVSTQSNRTLCDSCTETNHDLNELGVQTTNSSCDASVGTEGVTNSSDGISSETVLCNVGFAKTDKDSCDASLSSMRITDPFGNVCNESAEPCDFSAVTDRDLSPSSVCDSLDSGIAHETANFLELKLDKSASEGPVHTACVKNEFCVQEIESKLKVIEDLKKALESKSKDIEDLNEALESKLKVIEDLKEALESKSKDIEDFNEALESKLKVIEDLKVALESKSKDIEHLNEALKSKLKVIEDLKVALESKSKVTENLNEALESKSNLLESIHCQMDSLLTKVEELSEEITIKDQDLCSAGEKIEGLESIIKHLRSLQENKHNALLAVCNTIADLKQSKDSMSVEVNELQKVCLNMFHNAESVMSNMHAQFSIFCNNVESQNRETHSLEDEVSNLKESFVEIEQELCSLLEALKNTTFSVECPVVQCGLGAEKSDIGKHEDSDEIDSPREQVLCDYLSREASNPSKHSSEKVIGQIKLLHKELLKALDLINQLTVDNDKAIKELNNCKLQIIPNLEKNIGDLQLKLQEQTSNESLKKDQALTSSQLSLTETDGVQNNTEESENLQRQVAEAETKMNKFKLVAIRVKKELAETRKMLQDTVSEKEKCEKQIAEMSHELDKLSTVNHQHVRNFQSLQSEYDKLQDECEDLKAILKTLEGDLGASVAELNNSRQKYLDLEAEYEKSKSLLTAVTFEKQTEEKKIGELESKVIILEAKSAEKQKKMDDLESELSKSKNKILEIEEDRESVKLKLEEALKEGKKHSLLDLEMADYERTISELNALHEKKCEEISELHSDIEGLNARVESLQEEIGHCESRRITEEKRADNLKEILEKTKDELNTVRNHEQELSNVVKELRLQMEIIIQQGEDYKVQLAKVSAEAEQLKETLNSSAESHQKIVRSLEAKISALHEEILLAHKEVESGKQEFENYKIRVHSVLKQQKNGSSNFASNDAEIKEELQKVNEKLKLQITDLSEKLRACTLENETLQDDHEHLLLRYSKIVEEMEATSKSWSQKFEQVTTEKKRLEAAQEELISQHALQHSMLTTSFVKQIKDLQEQHKHEVKDMQKQLEAADIEIAHLQREQRNTSGVPSTPSAHDDPFPFDICSQERQEGEGSECTDGRNTPIKPMSLATIPTSGFLPLEKLLQSPVEPETPKSYISNQDSEKLSCDLNSSYKKIDHLSELLNESEANNLRLNEQVRVLKEEVRRLERNKEREKHAENLEYLKNIFVKFITLQSGDEKARLIPVLTTMLKLSPLEQQQLRSVSGESTETDASGGWGTYLHRWSGLI